MANNWNENRQDWDSFRSDERRGGNYDPYRQRSDESSSPYRDERSGMGSSRDRGYGMERGYDRDSDRNLDRNSDRGYDRDQERSFGSNRDFSRDRWGANEGIGYGYGGTGYGSRGSQSGGQNFGLSRSEGLRNDQNRGGSGLGYGGSERYGMSGSDISRSSDYGYGGSYGSSYGSTSTNRDINYGMGGDLTYQRGAGYAGRGPKGYKRSDERIREDVSEALARHPDIDASEIEVDVKEGLVTLRGSVDDRRTKRMAEDSVENLSGVRDVRNELSVNRSLFERAKEALTGESSESGKSKSSTKH